MEDNAFCLQTISRSQLEARDRQRERDARDRLDRAERANAKLFADSLVDSFCLRGSDRPADDLNQHALF